jgi:hypothetical protein
MSQHGSVTIWLDKIKDGSPDEAVDRLWSVYFSSTVSPVLIDQKSL